MKNIALLTIVTLIICCQPERGKHGVTAKLVVTEYTDKNTGDNLLVLTTIFDNKTEKDIYFIKGYPMDSEFSLQRSNNDSTDLGLDLKRISNPDLTYRVMNSSVNMINYLSKTIENYPEKKKIVDSIASLNTENIKINYENSQYKFKSQFAVLKKGESVEIDNTLITTDFEEKLIYNFNSKKKNEVDERKKRGELMVVPASIGNYVFWDGELNLDSKQIEVVFKKI